MAALDPGYPQHGMLLVSAARVPVVPRTSPPHSYKPSAVFPVAEGFGRVGCGMGPMCGCWGEPWQLCCDVVSNICWVTVTAWNESHHLRMRWVPNWPIAYPVSYVPVSLFPRLAMGHAGYQTVPHPSSLSLQLTEGHFGYQTVPFHVPHPSFLFPQLAKGHAGYQPVPSRVPCPISMSHFHVLPADQVTH